MAGHIRRKLDFRTNLLLSAVGLVITALPVAFSQANAAPQSRPPGAAATGDKLMFEVASVRRNKSEDDASMNISPLLWDGAVPAGGLYLARNIKLIQFIAFAYSLTQIQLRSVELQAPWTTEDRFDIEARAEGSPTKAQYRVMMQSLLADRFKLAVHYETRVVPLYVLVLAKPGKLGPHLRLHQANDSVCAQPAPPPGSPWRPIETDAQGFPESCSGPLSMQPSAPSRMKSGGRDVAMTRFAAIMTGVGVVDRPMVDETGLKGTVDYSLEWRRSPEQVAHGVRVEPDEDAPTFPEALKEQLGIKMVSRKGPSELFFIDHIEQPSDN
jgi:uncharacterized protein (TIGR03435 family)